MVFLFNLTANTAIYTLSLHDALPIYRGVDFGIWKKLSSSQLICPCDVHVERVARKLKLIDRKSTRLNSSHVEISYAVFCLKKKSTSEDNIECLKHNIKT